MYLLPVLGGRDLLHTSPVDVRYEETVLFVEDVLVEETLAIRRPGGEELLSRLAGYLPDVRPESVHDKQLGTAIRVLVRSAVVYKRDAPSVGRVGGIFPVELARLRDLPDYTVAEDLGETCAVGLDRVEADAGAGGDGGLEQDLLSIRRPVEAENRPTSQVPRLVDNGSEPRAVSVYDTEAVFAVEPGVLEERYALTVGRPVEVPGLGASIQPARAVLPSVVTSMPPSAYASYATLEPSGDQATCRTKR